jgi:hypothetical protein
MSTKGIATLVLQNRPTGNEAVVLVQQGSGLVKFRVTVVFGRPPSRDQVWDISSDI